MLPVFFSDLPLLNADLAHHWLPAIIAACFGLCMGSFLTVVIYRLPIMIQHAWDNYLAQANQTEAQHTDTYNLLHPALHCPHCNTAFSWKNSLPIISFFYLKRQCPACHQPISRQYPLIESISGLLSAYLVWHFGTGLTGIAALCFLYFCIALCFIDLKTLLLPDTLTLPLLWIGLLVNLNGTFTPIQDAVLGAVIGYLFLWSVHWCFKCATGQDGVGYGDFKLLAALGAWLGWEILPLLVLGSAILGGLVGLTLVLRKKHQKDNPLPFGPYLTISGMLALLYGNQILAILF